MAVSLLAGYFGLILLVIVLAFVRERWLERRIEAAPGKLIDVNGMRIHVLSSGETIPNAPTVVLEAGIGGYSLEWHLVQSKVAEFARMCSYDRPGYGWSDVARTPRTPENIACELHQVLQEAHIPAPYILVGHSIGGLYIRDFARLFGSDVAGMVLVDSVHPGQWGQPQINKTSQLINFHILRPLTRLGLLRYAATVRMRKTTMPLETLRRYVSVVHRGMLHSVIDELNGFVNNTVPPANILGDKPLIVLSHTPGTDKFSATWERLQMELLNYSTDSERRTAKHSTHYIHLDDPDLIVNAIRDVLAA